MQALADSLPVQSYCYPLDVTDAAALAGAASDFIAVAGIPDIVIANAGISAGTLTEEAEDVAVFRRIFDVNVMGAINTFQPFIGPMKAAGNGRLVGISSVAGIRGLPGAGAYSASKSALTTYLESLRVELADSGVRVVTIAPGYIETPMTAVNTYSMPFLLPVDEAARRFAVVIERGKAYTIVPWQMGLVAGLLKWLPRPIYDHFAAQAGRKPRKLPL